MSAASGKPTPEQALALRVEAPFVLVAASAGTGKTRTLVEKALRAVRGGVPLESLAVITFTRKAADELRRKLYAAFQEDEALRPRKLALPQAYIATIDSFCTRLLREHGLKLPVDPAFRVLAGPDDEVVLAEILDRIFDRWYQGLGPEPQDDPEGWAGVPRRGSAEHREFLRLVDLCRYRRGRELLKEEIVRLLALARHYPDPPEFISTLSRAVEAEEPPYLSALVETLDRSWRAGRAAYAEVLRLGVRLVPPEKLAKQQELDAALERADWPADRAALARELPGALERARRHLAAGGWVAADGAWKLAFPRLPAGTAELKPLHDLAKGLLDSSGAKPGSPFSRLPWPIARMHDAYRATRPTVGALIALARQTLEAYESHKRREGLLDFADLELHTRRLLLDPPPSLRGRFQLVLVDEFQDVNDLQAGIVDRLAPQRGRFLVGDVKQCIYQFRLANPEVFRGLVSREARWLTPESCPEDQPAPEGERLVVPLGVNFRSRRPVVDAVNAVFEELLTPEMIGCDYRSVALRYGYEAGLEPAPAAERGERGRSPTEIHILAREEGAKEEKPRSRVSAGEILAAEARLVARRLGELRDGGFEVFDRERKTWRRAGWADMVVLLRAPGSVGGRFAQALRAAGVPALFGIQPFFEREEIRDARNLLRILDNAHDDIGLAGLLRAPTVGFDDDDLLRLRLAWPESPTLIASLRAAAGEAGEPAGACAAAALFEEPAGRELAARCAAFLERLDRWRLQAQSGDLADAVTAACAEAGLLTAAASREGGIERAGNLQQLVALARRFAGERGHSLPGFVRYLDTIEASGGGPEAVASGDPAEPAARILSMHKAKGLEFPIVVLPLLGRSFNPTDAARSVLVGERWIGIDHFDPRTYVKEPTLARYLLAERRMMEIREEELRILYVAMTRAVEKLILTMAVASPWDEMLARLGPWRAPGAVRDAAARRIRSTGEALLGVLHRSDALAALTRPGMEAAWRESCTIHRHDLGSGAADGEGEPPPADGPLPETAPLSLEAALAALPALRRRVAAVYPHAAATRWRGKYWVTEVKRLIDRAREAEERAAGSELPRAPDPVPGAGMRGGRAAESGAARAAIDPAGAWPAADEGRWLHAILQELDLAAPDPFACARQLSARGEVPPAWISPENLDPIVRFLSSPLAAEMAAAPELQREASFSLRLPPGDLARIWPAAAELPPDEWILIQGQIDVLWPRPGGGYRLIDFKSDRPGVDRWLERAERYRPQMLLYREALRRIWGAGEVAGAIHFLRAGETVRVF